MPFDRNLLAVIGRISPEAFDAIFPRGPLMAGRTIAQRGELAQRAELNPQPLPPHEVFGGIEVGVAVAQELVRAAGFARAVGLELTLDVREFCPPPKLIPPLPWPWPWPGPWPGPWPWRDGEPGPDYDYGYALGLGATLEASAESWTQLPSAGFFEELYGVAADIATRQG